MLESKSTCKYSVEIEKLAVKYFTKRHKLIGFHVKSHFAELDIIIRSQSGYHILEVKSQGLDMDFQPRVHKKQAQRLMNAQEDLINRFNIALRVHLAIVTRNAKIKVFPDFLADI